MKNESSIIFFSPDKPHIRRFYLCAAECPRDRHCYLFQVPQIEPINTLDKMNVSMRPSSSGTPTSGQSEQRMAHRDDEEQLPSNNDTGSSSNGTTSNLLSLSSNNPNMTFLLAPSSCLRRTSEDGIDLHENASSRKRVCDEAHAESTEEEENNNAQPSRQARKAKTMPLVSNESIHTPILQNSTNVP